MCIINLTVCSAEVVWIKHISNAELKQKNYAVVEQNCLEMELGSKMHKSQSKFLRIS